MSTETTTDPVCLQLIPPLHDPTDDTVTIRYLSTLIEDLTAEVSRLSDLVERKSRVAPRPNLDRILHLCSVEFETTPEIIVSQGQTQPVVLARQCVMWILRRNGMSLQFIGSKMERSATNVYHALKSFEAKLSTTKSLNESLRRIENGLEVGCA